ncbi:hypothetical protein M9458_002771, partial [Cirrhinus mrigala]
YHQLTDEYFTGAVVLSLILTALIGILYLLIMPQYVQQSIAPSHRHTWFHYALLQSLDFVLGVY